MAVPVQLTTNVQNETFGGVTYHIEGELVPALHVELGSTGIYFEHHILLWKDPAVQVALRPMKGAYMQAHARGNAVPEYDWRPWPGTHRLQS